MSAITVLVMCIQHPFVPVLSAADPMKWTEEQVSQWLDWAVHEFGFSPITKSSLKLPGLQLCALSQEEFLERAPPYTGDVLYSHLNLLKAKGVELHTCFGLGSASGLEVLYM